MLHSVRNDRLAVARATLVWRAGIVPGGLGFPREIEVLRSIDPEVTWSGSVKRG